MDWLKDALYFGTVWDEKKVATPLRLDLSNDPMRIDCKVLAIERRKGETGH
jgi:hypothetical protein